MSNDEQSCPRFDEVLQDVLPAKYLSDCSSFLETNYSSRNLVSEPGELNLDDTSNADNWFSIDCSFDMSI